MPPEPADARRQLGNLALDVAQHHAARRQARQASDAPETKSAR
jgi:hypothetical protein